MNTEMEDLFRQLTDAEKQELKALLLDDQEHDAENVATDYPAECPHCQHQDIVRNGSINKTPRFKCKECTKTFSFNTNKLRYKSRKSRAVWSQYLDFMFQGLSLRKLEDAMDLLWDAHLSQYCAVLATQDIELVASSHPHQPCWHC